MTPGGAATVTPMSRPAGLVVVVLVRHDPREDQPGESAPDEIVST